MNEWIAVDIIGGWIDRHGIQVLNVAGPRASKDPGIHGIVVGVLGDMLAGASEFGG